MPVTNLAFSRSAIRPSKVNCVPVDAPIQSAGVVSCRCCSGRFCSFYCAVFGPGLPINRVNSLLINICRIARSGSSKKKKRRQKHLGIFHFLVFHLVDQYKKDQAG